MIQERTNNSQEWYTPKYIIDALGHFDLDPCSPIEPLFKIADKTYSVEDDGLMQNWGGVVYMNPPYKHPLIDKFVDKMVRHNNGIALLFSRFDSSMWQKKIFPTATAMLVLSGRVKFLTPDGRTLQGAGCGSVLISWGDECAERLKNCSLSGYYIKLNNEDRKRI